VKVGFAPRALESIRYRQRWWRAHRDHGALFGDELRAVLAKLRDNTDAARQRYSGDDEATVWRLLMPKTRHHVYYQRNERANTAHVVLVDSAVSAEGPEL
jgi:hypothetical protein